MRPFLNNNSTREDNSQQPSQSLDGNPPYPRYPVSTYPPQATGIYVLPHPPPTYNEYYQQQPDHSTKSDPQITTQTNSLQSGQSNPESSRQLNENNSGQPTQRIPSSNQTPYQPQPPPYYTAPQQPYYGPWTQQPAYHYPGHQYAAPPSNAAESSMIREAPFRRQEEEPEPEGWSGFSDDKIRATFIRKVYIILTLQLLFTFGIIALFIYEPNVKRFVQENIYLYYVSVAIFFPVYIGLICFQSVRRRFPVNIIALVIFTMAMSYMCATISTTYDTDAVLLAAGICAVVCFSITIFSFYTKFDFTSCGGVLCILLLILLLFGIISIIFKAHVMKMIYAGFGAAVFCLMLAYNTQMMMGGKNYELSPEEYVFAAVQLYIDIIYIFLFLLMLVGGEN